MRSQRLWKSQRISNRNPPYQSLPVAKPLDEKLNERIVMKSYQDFFNKTGTLLTLIGIFCLLIYLYISFYPFGQQVVSKAHGIMLGSTCLDNFKFNNCTINNPTSEVCKQLHKCLKKYNISFVNDEEKISAVQELLENILLVFGGMGIIGFITKNLIIIEKFIGLCKRIKQSYEKKNELSEANDQRSQLISNEIPQKKFHYDQI